MDAFLRFKLEFEKKINLYNTELIRFRLSYWCLDHVFYLKLKDVNS